MSFARLIKHYPFITFSCQIGTVIFTLVILTSILAISFSCFLIPQMSMVSFERHISLLVGAIVLFICIFFYGLVDITLIRPIHHLTDLMKQIAQSDSPILLRSEEKTPELCQLNQAFLLMLQRLQINHQKIDHLNTELRLVNQTLRHDILNRLFYIGGIVGNYEKFGEKAMPLQDMLTDIRKMVQNSADFIQNMKTVEEQTVSNAPLRPIDIEKVIKSVTSDFDDLHITVTGSGIVLADQGVVSIIANLLQNIRVHARSKEVHISVKESIDEITVAIADEGKGIPDDIKAQLFQQGHAFGTTGNSGIGLYVVKHMMQRYGGNVLVSNHHPHGTVFTLYFKKALM